MADILVVDDDVSLAEAVTDILTEAGHRVRIAHNGCEGVAALDERLPDLVLLDVEMPLLDGPGMAYQMLIEDAGRERIPIAFVSGSLELPRAAERVGTPYALGKPCSIEQLMGVVDRALRERTPPHPLLTSPRQVQVLP